MYGVVFLISSIFNPLAPIDELSDLDNELVFENNEKYVLNDNRAVSLATLLQ